MCRWLVWCGSEPILLADLILSPAHSLIHQSFSGGFHPGADCQNNMTLNADGFGVGWYTKHGAAIFRSVTAAWNNRNLREMCSTIESQCIFAHVRAASEGGVISEQNCHPFRYGRLLFQHNGHIEAFKTIKRRVMNSLRDDLFTWIEGTTDSEACFALVLNEIDPALLTSGEPIPPKVLQSALLNAIALLASFITEANIVDGFSTYNFALTDGVTVVVSRYCDKAPRIPSPSLYYAFADNATLRAELLRSTEASTPCAPGHGARSIVNQLTASHGANNGCGAGGGKDGAATLEASHLERGSFICASEPLTTQLDQWHLIGENTMLCFTLKHGLCEVSADSDEGSPQARRSGSGANAAATDLIDNGKGALSRSTSSLQSPADSDEGSPQTRRSGSGATSAAADLTGKGKLVGTALSRSTSSLQSSLVLSPPASPGPTSRRTSGAAQLPAASDFALDKPAPRSAMPVPCKLPVNSGGDGPSPILAWSACEGRVAALEPVASSGSELPLPPSTPPHSSTTRLGGDGRVSVMPLSSERLQKILDERPSDSAAWRQRFVISALSKRPGATQ